MKTKLFKIILLAGTVLFGASCNEEEFLKGSSKLALRAREMLGVNTSEQTVAKIGRRDGCISNVTEWLHLGAMAKRDEVLTQVLKT